MHGIRKAIHQTSITMPPNKLLLTALLVCVLTTAYSQHHQTEKNTVASPITFDLVLRQALSDPELTDYKMESLVMTLAPGAADTVSHRHDCELFGYVMEGEIQIALVTKEPNTFSTGQMFYEKRNILHTLARNPSQEKTTRVLLIFIIKNGRTGYTAEYAGKKTH
ncbi:cupin domain-containing protein [Chryseolinea soli]|uniref:Cupin domain-containing protein n=2 Tax=Chryseolinea soli TaxID=2321403 RepID=A0A385STD8_9BACT|nr:cupin domain-containing protein [Chryseolinea soli]